MCSDIIWKALSPLGHFLKQGRYSLPFDTFLNSNYNMSNYKSVAIYRGRMRADELEKAIELTIAKGCTPLFVNATSGTTVLGAYDPVDQIADVCEKYEIWLHVDVSTRYSVYFKLIKHTPFVVKSVFIIWLLLTFSMYFNMLNCASYFFLSFICI